MYIYRYHYGRHNYPVSTMWLGQWRLVLTAEVSRVQWGRDHLCILRNCTVIGVNDDWTSVSINTFICTCMGTLFCIKLLMTYAMHEHSKEYFKTSSCYVYQETMFHGVCISVCTLAPSCDHVSNYSLNSDTLDSRVESIPADCLPWFDNQNITPRKVLRHSSRMWAVCFAFFSSQRWSEGPE